MSKCTLDTQAKGNFIEYLKKLILCMKKFHSAEFPHCGVMLGGTQKVLDFGVFLVSD